MAFSPLDITNCKLWLSADTGVYIDAARTTPVSSDSDAVGGWADQSGQNNHFSQATAGNKPVYKISIINGKPVIRFNGTASYLTGTATLFASDHFSLFVVCEGTATNGASMLCQSTGGAGRCLVGCSTYTPFKQIRLYFNNGTTQNLSGGAVCWDGTNFNIINIEGDDAGNFYSRINGALEAENLTGQAWTPQAVAPQLGVYNSTTNWWAGDIAEIVFYSRKLTDAEREQVELYLIDRYDLPDWVTFNTNAFAALITTASSYLTTPTYDGSGQVVHPSVYDAGSGKTWNGKRYWMAMSPYPGANGTFENPSILNSNNGTTWTVPAGLTNPIDTPDSSWGYSDPDLFMSEKVLYCIWRGAKSGQEKIYEKYSTDGVLWSDRVEILSVDADENHSVCSPSIIWGGSQYMMYCIDALPHPHTMTRRTASSIAGPWSDPVICTISRGNLVGTPGYLWHLDVIKEGIVFIAIICDDYNGGFVGVSYDGLNWQLSGKKHTGGTWDAIIYRGTLAYNGTDLDYWYSARALGSPEVWHIGKTSVTGITIDMGEAVVTGPGTMIHPKRRRSRSAPYCTYDPDRLVRFLTSRGSHV